MHTPDLFDGHTFDTLEEGLGYAGRVGFGAVTDRGVRAVEELPAEVVYSGFSLGVVPAQQLAQTRPGARGALFFHSCIPVSEFGSSWPDGVSVQVHGMDADSFFVDDGDLAAARALVEEAPHAQLFLYPGEQHLFADSSLSSYDAEPPHSSPNGCSSSSADDRRTLEGSDPVVDDRRPVCRERLCGKGPSSSADAASAPWAPMARASAGKSGR